MKLPTPEWRAWIYMVAWLGSGIAAYALAIWLIVLVRYGWPAATASQRLDIIGNTLFGVIGIVALVALGLTMRNAIRSIKGTAGGASIDVTATDAPAAAQAVADTAQETADEIKDAVR